MRSFDKFLQENIVYLKSYKHIKYTINGEIIYYTDMRTGYEYKFKLRPGDLTKPLTDILDYLILNLKVPVYTEDDYVNSEIN